MDDEALSLAFGSEPSSEGDSGQAQGGNADGTPLPDAGSQDGQAGAESKEPPQGDGTADPAGQAKPAGEEASKGVYPKELEPFKALIESRKWDLTKPADVAQLAKAYTEVEKHASQSQTHTKNSQDKASRIASIAGGSVEDLNKWRKSQGLPEIKSESRTYEEREKEVQDLYDSVDKALSGDKDALKQLQGYFDKRFQDLRVDKAVAEKYPGKSADQVFSERKSIGQANFAAVVKADPQAKVYFDELTEHFSPGGVLDSLGVDVLDAASTPERLAAFVEMGRALNFYRNRDKVVQEKVTAELERRRTAGNAGGAGQKPGGGKQKATAGAEQAADFTHLF